MVPLARSSVRSWAMKTSSDPMTFHRTSAVHTQMREYHVFEDMMQLVDWVRDGTPLPVTAEHARHVIDIIEAYYRAVSTGETQELRTSFRHND